MDDSSDPGGRRKGRRRRLLAPRLALRLRIRLPRVSGRKPLPFRLPRPRGDARRAVRFLSDARAAERGARVGSPAPLLDLRQRVRVGSIVAALCALFCLGTLISVFGARGFQDLRRSRQELEELRARLEAQQEKVAELRHVVQRLREDPASMEAIAREQLGYARPGEVIFLLPRESPFGLAPTEGSILDRAPAATDAERAPEEQPGPF